MEKKNLKPAGVFHYFEEICQVPRPSKHEEKIIAYLKEFGQKHHLDIIGRSWQCVNQETGHTRHGKP